MVTRGGADNPGRQGMPYLLRAIMMSAAFVRFMGSHLATEEEAGQALGRLITDPNFAGSAGGTLTALKKFLLR